MRLWPVLVLTWAQVGPGAPSPQVALAITDKVISIIGTLSGIPLDMASDDTNEQLLQRFDAVTASIARLEKEVRSVSLGPLRNFDEVIGGQVSWGNAMETLDDLLQNVHSKYDRFLLYQQRNVSVEHYTLADFAREVVSHSSDSAQSTMYRLRDLVLGGDHRRYTFKAGLFRELQSVLKESNTMVCGLEQSPQQLAYSLLVILLMTLGKIHSMVQFSYMLLNVTRNGTFITEKENHSANYQSIFEAVTLETVSVIRDLPPSFWRCDPKTHERGATYEEVTELLQGHIENEVDLNNGGSCTSSCSDYRAVRTDRCYGAEDWSMPCERQIRCRGTQHDCRFIASTATVCTADAYEDPHRRYNWIKYGDGQTLGRSDGALSSCAETLEMSSWNRWFAQCSYCFCLCDDDTHSERFFSLLPVESDIDENNVVTGVRLVKKNGVFYIKLEQGVADELGYVKPSSEQWKPIDREIDINRDVEGHQYVRLSYERRSVLLQDLRAPPGHVVTGVSFNTIGELLSLKIRVTQISVDGVLARNSSWWVSGSVSAPTSSQLDLGSDLELPTQSRTPSWPDSQPGQTLTFAASSAATDAAQTTLPLLDAQPVAPRPAFWLAGVGLYHKGQPGNGGFLGLSVVQMAVNI